MSVHNNKSIEPGDKFKELPLRLYEVKKDAKNKGVIVLERVKIDPANLDNVRKVVKLINAGQIWIRTGTKAAGFKYAYNVNQQTINIAEIKEIYLRKVDRTDPEKKLMNAPLADNQKNVSAKLEALDDNAEEQKELKKIKKDLEKFVEQQSKILTPSHHKAQDSTSAQSKRVLLEEAGKSSLSEFEKTQESRSNKEMQKEITREEQEAIEEHRADAREQEEISEEMDEKSDARRQKDKKIEQKHEDVMLEDEQIKIHESDKEKSQRPSKRS